MKIQKLKSKKSGVLFIILTFLSIYLILITSLYFYFKDRFYLGTNIVYYSVGSMTKSEALSLTKSIIKSPERIDVKAKDETFGLLLNDIDFSYDLEKTVDLAYQQGRHLNIIRYLNPLVYLANNKNFKLVINFNQNKLDEYLQVISGSVAKEPIPPSVKLISGEISVNKGQEGEYLDKASFTNIFLNNLTNNKFDTIQLSFLKKDESLSDSEEKNLKERAKKLIGKNISLENEYDVIGVKDSTLLSFLDGKKSYSDENVIEYIEKNIAPSVNRDPQNAVFWFEDDRVKEFKPAKNGLTIDSQLLKDIIIENLEILEKGNEKVAKITIPTDLSKPKITIEDVNNLGIKELIGRGSSKFAGSIPGRIHNVGLASSKFANILVGPGETLSFNELLGDVSSYTGYKQAYIIKDGRTVLGDGGGVCQVSTTLFRAALNAGLPIVERRAHSYRVGYYEQDSGPGIDATVFSPTSDLKIINDTPGHILIQSIYNKDKLTLVFEIYGTSDGRVASITKPVVAGVTAPPPDLYVDDPTLPVGQIKQVDHKAWGAKVSFNYKVERNGETIIDKIFYSNYRPWQSVFMRGTKI